MMEKEANAKNAPNTEIRDGDWLPMAYVGFAQLHDNGPQSSNTFSQELRLTSPADQTLSYVVGLYYSRAESERTFTRNVTQCTAAVGAPTGVLIPCGSINANAATTPNGSATFGSVFNNFAVFTQATLKLGDKARLIGGLRYTNDKLAVFHSRRSPLTGPGIQANFDQGVYDEYVRLVGLGTAPTTAATAAAPPRSRGTLRVRPDPRRSGGSPPRIERSSSSFS